MTHTRRRAGSHDIDRRWAIYLRFSKDDELHRDDALDRHERQLRTMFRERGLRGEIVGVYADRDRSAFRPKVKRPEFDRLVDDLKNGVVTGVLCYKADRLYRRLRDLEMLIDLVGTDDPPRVAIVCLRSGDIDLSTAGGRTTARILGSIAAGESEATSERLRDFMTDKAIKGTPAGGRRPFGYCDDKVTPHEIEAPLYAEAVERIAAGESLTRVADDLNARGVRSSTGTPFTIVTVRQLVTSPRYIGRRVHRGVDVGAAAWPALVDEATWRRANALIAERRGKRRAARRYLLSGGIARCGKCDAGMVGRPQYHRGQTVPVYHCPSCHGCKCERERRAARDRFVIETIEGDDSPPRSGRARRATTAPPAPSRQRMMSWQTCWRRSGRERSASLST